MKPEELTPYEVWQLNRYGNIIQDANNIPEEELFESGIQELERFGEYLEMLNEQKMLKEEEMFAAIKENH